MNIVPVKPPCLYTTTTEAAFGLPASDSDPSDSATLSVTHSGQSQGSPSRSENNRAYPAPAEVPTQQAPEGVRYDFNDGCRVVLPEAEHPWRVRLNDLDTGNILYETEIKAGRVNSTKRYFVRFRLDVWTQGTILFSHEYSAKDRAVLIQFPVGTIGDTIG